MICKQPGKISLPLLFNNCWMLKWKQIGYSKNERTDNNNYRNGHYLERTVETEMGDIPVKVPRDRNGEIDSDLVPKYSRTANGLMKK